MFLAIFLLSFRDFFIECFSIKNRDKTVLIVACGRDRKADVSKTDNEKKDHSKSFFILKWVGIISRLSYCTSNS